MASEQPSGSRGARVQNVQGCRGDTHFLHLLHPSARFAPICQVCTHLPGLHPSARFAPFMSYATRITWISPGPCTPVTSRNSMSPVLLGPVIKVRQAGGSATGEKRSNRSKRSGKSCDDSAKAMCKGGRRLTERDCCGLVAIT